MNKMEKEIIKYEGMLSRGKEIAYRIGNIKAKRCGVLKTNTSIKKKLKKLRESSA